MKITDSRILAVLAVAVIVATAHNWLQSARIRELRDRIEKLERK